MKNIFKLSTFVAAVAAMFTLAACSTEELDTDQYSSKAVLLQAYGPQPVVRGGVLRFVGSNLDKVATVSIPGVAPLTPEVVTSGTHSEIRVTVPKDGPEVGYPVLTLSDGTTLTGKTQLSYSEPITIESFTPAEILPGQILTIEGDYLNNIHEVIFADNVKVSETAFTTHDRYTISVAVPEEARTGKVGLGTVDELTVEGSDNEATLLATLNIVETETELIVTTAKGTLATANLKAGAKATINGTNLNLTKAIALEGAIVEEFAATASKIEFTLPATATDGDVFLVMASGVEVSAGTLATVVPTNLSAKPSPVKNGATLTVGGKDLDLVTGVELPGAGYVDFTAASEITLTVPEAAQAGDVTLHLENGKTVTVAYVLVEPVITEFSANPASAGSELVITGSDLDLVAAVTFGGGLKVDVEATETSITVAVPTAAQTGVLVLNLKNGTSLETKELAIDSPAGAYIPVVPEDVFSPGDMLIVEIANADKLKSVRINDDEVTFIVSGTTLYVQIPVDAKAGSTITLVSDEGTVTYPLNIDPGTEATYVLWSGSEDMGSWSNQPYIGEYGSLLANGAVAGDAIRVYYIPGGDWYQLQIFDGNWGGMTFSELGGGNTISPDTITEYTGYFEFKLTAEQLARLNSIDNWGGLFVVQGENCTVTQITLTHFFKQETTIWEGSEHIGWSGMGDLSWGGYDWSTVAAGTVLTAYYTLDGDQDYWQMRIGNGSWSSLPCGLALEPSEGNIELEEGSTSISLTLTQDDIDVLVGNDGLVMTGTNYTLTKLTLM